MTTTMMEPNNKPAPFPVGELNVMAGGNTNTSPLYTVVYAGTRRNWPSPLALRHGSDDAEVTLCGRAVTEKWFIVDNRGTGAITCHACEQKVNQRKR